MTEIVIYTKQGCPYCHRAMELLAAKNLAYKEIDAGNNPFLRAEMVERSGGRNSFPQIFINGRPIGGCDELYTLEKNNMLDSLVHKGHHNDPDLLQQV